MKKVIHNLIDNAIKFTAQGQVRIRAWNQQTGEDTCDLHLSVQDTGFGISPELQVKIFEPFTQVDSSTTRRHGGNGLGLAICRQLVELMNGRITLKKPARKRLDVLRRVAVHPVATGT
ncbi:ATP-binding protein [Candidatus Competibacter phosphatis]|uniref:ATP-binding protein n=1 Tax=Candidatus Competibacter phosphatis TaxID=221280 RepID=UPI00145DE050|nr:ATP-binding protein [Candidatus Competibacter phosphatis]